MYAMWANFLPSMPHKKSVNISEPITVIDFIFGTNIALHRAINIFSQNFEKIQVGYAFLIFCVHMKRFNILEPMPWIYFIFGAKLQFFKGNILEHIGRMYFLFHMNVALYQFFFEVKKKNCFVLNFFLGNFFDKNFILNYKKKSKWAAMPF